MPDARPQTQSEQEATKERKEPITIGRTASGAGGALYRLDLPPMSV